MTKNTKKNPVNKELAQALATLKKHIKNARESSRIYTAGIIWAFLCGKQDYKKTEAKIRDMVKDSYGVDWEAAKGAENKKIRFARVIFESRLEALESCESADDVLAYLKQNADELTFSKVLNVNQNQKEKSPRHKIEKPESESDSNLYGKPNPVKNPNPESESMELIAFLKSAVKNPQLLQMINTKLASDGIHIQYVPSLRKVA